MTLLVEQFHVERGTEHQLPLRFNIAPTQDIPVIRHSDQGRELAVLRWGLIPPWTKDPKKGSLLINARSDTVAEKPAFRCGFRDLLADAKEPSLEGRRIGGLSRVEDRRSLTQSNERVLNEVSRICHLGKAPV